MSESIVIYVYVYMYVYVPNSVQYYESSYTFCHFLFFLLRWNVIDTFDPIFRKARVLLSLSDIEYDLTIIMWNNVEFYYLCTYVNFHPLLSASLACVITYCDTTWCLNSNLWVCYWKKKKNLRNRIS